MIPIERKLEDKIDEDLDRFKELWDHVSTGVYWQTRKGSNLTLDIITNDMQDEIRKKVHFYAKTNIQV